MNTILFTAALFSALALTAMAGDSKQALFQAPALLIKEDGSFQRAWLTAATKSSIHYRETEAAVDSVEAELSDFKTVFLFEPREFAAAMDLYQARRYEEAKKEFIAVKERFKTLYPLENSHAALAAFYEMECLRKLGDLEGLAATLQKFDKSQLTRDTQLRQLELYVLWDAVRTKSWDAIDKLARERAKTRLPGDQRAQVAYCHGLALEGLKRPEEALFAYQTAMTADSGASEEIARQAALRVLSILNADAEVRKAIQAWGTKEENKSAAGYARLTEAAAVASLFEMTLGAGFSLPAEFQELLKYRPATGD
jgi:tetratricopeptide (TPR) repeat protein